MKTKAGLTRLLGSAQEGLVQARASMQGPVYSHLISLPGTCRNLEPGGREATVCRQGGIPAAWGSKSPGLSPLETSVCAEVDILAPFSIELHSRKFPWSNGHLPGLGQQKPYLQEPWQLPAAPQRVRTLSWPLPVACPRAPS